MGIGVSYTGYDGKTRNAVAESTADLQRIMGETRRTSVQNMAKVPKVGDNLKFSTMNDPVDGPLIGIEGNGRLEPDGQYRAVGSRGGWRIPITRTEMKIRPSLEMKCNEVILAKLQYDLIISEKGLVKGRTEEREVWTKKFFVLADGEDASSNGKYGVRAFWNGSHDSADKPHLNFMGFGSEQDLDSWDEKEKKFLCNYDESGNLLEDPPVKVVETDRCYYAQEE